MLDLYINTKNTIGGLESALRIAISNANNFNTPGFKYTYASFTTVYNEVLTSGTESTNPLDLGPSMTLGSTSTDFSQGSLTLGTNNDIAISGEGFFAVSASAADFSSGAPKLFTRAGRFNVDSSNTFLVDDFGRKVYGFKLDSAGNRISNDLVPIETNGNLDVGFVEGGIFVSNWAAARDDVGLGAPMYQVALTTFQNKNGLVPANGSAFETTVASGQNLGFKTAGEQIGDAGTTVFGDVLPESLESSNIDVAKVSLDMNIINRGFSAATGVLDDINKIISNLISKIAG